MASSYELDNENPLSVKGWAVLRESPWHLDSLHVSKSEAKVRQQLLGADYHVQYGSRQLATDNFMYLDE